MDSAAAEIWTLAANDVEDESKDPIDADELLDPEDLEKPDPASRKAPSGGEREKKKKKKKRGKPVRTAPVVLQKNWKE